MIRRTKRRRGAFFFGYVSVRLWFWVLRAPWVREDGGGGAGVVVNGEEDALLGVQVQKV